MIQGSDCGALRMQRARLMEENERLRQALEELVLLVEDIRQGEYVPDSFTTQPARIALAARPLLKN